MRKLNNVLAPSESLVVTAVEDADKPAPPATADDLFARLSAQRSWAVPIVNFPGDSCMHGRKGSEFRDQPLRIFGAHLTDMKLCPCSTLRTAGTRSVATRDLKT